MTLQQVLVATFLCGQLSSHPAGEFFAISGCPLPSDPSDVCSFAPACLGDLWDIDAAEWLAAAASQPPPLVFEGFPSDDEADYPDLWFQGPAAQRSLDPDEELDFMLTLMGTAAGGTEVQSQDNILPLARDRIRVWFRFRHSTRGDPLNDTTLGLEHFNLDMEGGFLGIDPETSEIEAISCLEACESARKGGAQCDSGPPASCTPAVATDEAHFGVLLDLDHKLLAVPPVTSVAGLFVDGSACGHLACSPWGGTFQDQSSDFDPALWHLLLIEYRPDVDVGTTFCFDGNELVTDQLSSLLPSLLPALVSANQTLRLRVSAKREKNNSEDQLIEVDWFAFHKVPIFRAGFEAGNAKRWSRTVP